MNDSGLFRQNWDETSVEPLERRPRGGRHGADGPPDATAGTAGVETVPWSGWPPAAPERPAADAPRDRTSVDPLEYPTPAVVREHLAAAPEPWAAAAEPVVARAQGALYRIGPRTGERGPWLSSSRAPALRRIGTDEPGTGPDASSATTRRRPGGRTVDDIATPRTATTDPPAVRLVVPDPPDPAPALPRPHDTPPAPRATTAPAPNAAPLNAATPAGAYQVPQDEPVPDAERRRPASLELTHDALTRPRADVPRLGWRAALHRGSRGLLNPGISEVERARRLLRARVQRPVFVSRRIAVISVKGGIGKTTTAACLGSALAEIRGDQVCVVDANPDAGTLADRLTGDTRTTIRDLLRGIDGIATLTDISSYMSMAGRLSVLASDQDPAVSDALTATEYETAIDVLGRYFSVVITDAGTGISHPTMEPTLRTADGLVVVGGPTVDGASRAGHTLDWLESHGYAAEARNAVVVLSGDRTSRDVDAGRIASHFASRVRSVVTVPQDPHLAVGGRIEFDRLRAATRDAYVTVAAHIADQFPDRAG